MTGRYDVFIGGPDATPIVGAGHARPGWLMTDHTAPPVLSNATIADRLTSLAQLLSTQKENPFKVKAYRRAAEIIRALPDSVEDMVRRDVDLTEYSRIGKGISSAIRE